MTDFHNWNCTWILKHIMARIEDIGRILNVWNKMVTQRKFSMMQLYEALIEDDYRTDWYHMLSHDFARPRVKFIM